MKLYLLDAYALIYRGYFPFVSRPRLTSQGDDTSAVVGFLNTFDDILRRSEGEYIAVAFDPKGPTFRHEMYPEYKANRERTPDAISFGVPFIREIIEAQGVKIFEVPGYEADDVIGTVAHRAAERYKGLEVFMITPDKDYGQLVTGNVHILKPGKGAIYEDLGPKEVAEKHGLESAAQVIDFLALMGDKADNVPGVPKVGEKTAAELLREFGTIDGIYAQIDSVQKKAVKASLIENRDQLMRSKTLVTIEREVPVDFTLEDLRRGKPDTERLEEIYSKLELRSKLEKLRTDTPKKAAAPAQTVKRSLFDEPTEARTFAPVLPSEAPADLDTIDTVRHDYRLILTKEETEDLVRKLSASPVVAFDTETTGLDPLRDRIVGISFSIKPFEAYYVPMPRGRAEVESALEPFRRVFSDPKILKVGQNIKFDLKVLYQYGLYASGPYWDTMVAHYLISPELRHNMDDLSETLLGYKPIPITKLIGSKGKRQKTMDQVPVLEVAPYASEDADVTLRLYEYLRPKIEASEALKHLFYDIEMPVTEVLFGMEVEGVRLDDKLLGEAVREMKEDLSTLQEKIYDSVGLRFNINSPKEVGEVLFDHLKLVSNASKTRTGQYRTNEETLQKIAPLHPAVSMILDYRGLNKLISTYVEPLPGYINPRDGRVHTTYNQAVAATGRLSSADPNLQNIPVRDEQGRQLRKAFTGHNPSNGDLFVSADYSQIELRLLAHYSGDRHMIEAFKNDEDIHAVTASRIYGVAKEEVTSEQRRRAKTANFGINYGISAFGLSSRLNISRTEAKEIIDGYFASFPGIKDYMDDTVRGAREDGYVETLLGRRRYIPGINDSNAVARGNAERNAINAPIQGTAADIIKIAMVRVAERLKEEGLESKMLLQVHDELCFTCPSGEKERLVALVKETMEGVCPELSVPLRVDVGVGRDWLEAH